MQSRIVPPLLHLIACAASAGFATTAIAAGNAPGAGPGSTPGTAAPVFGQPATAPDAFAVPGSAAASPGAGNAQWDMDGKTERTERRAKRKRPTTDGSELWTNPGGTREDAAQKNAPAFP